MRFQEIAAWRLHNQLIMGSRCTTPAAVASHMLALQAQDYLAALWAVGVRMPEATEAGVEQALAEGSILRTWPLRGTLHVVAAEDARWLLELLAPRVEAAAAGRHRQLGIDAPVLHKAQTLLMAALEGGKQLTRPDCMQLLQHRGIATEQQRGYHILWWLALNQIICCGPRQGKQQTFVLLSEWAPQAKTKPREEALGELARRYFTAHGPATLADFMTWAGLTMADARAAVALSRSRLLTETVHGTTYFMPKHGPQPAKAGAYLLPSFDELLLGYKDRRAVLQEVNKNHITPYSNGIFNPLLVVNNQIVGTWKRTLKKETVEVKLTPFSAFKSAEKSALGRAAERYAAFLGRKLELV